MIATGWRQPGSTFKIFTYGGLVEHLVKQAQKGKGTVDDVAAQVREQCNVLDAPFEVPLGRGRGVKRIENFHSRSEPQYRGAMSCRTALGESRNTAAMRAGATAGIRNVIDAPNGGFCAVQKPEPMLFSAPKYEFGRYESAVFTGKIAESCCSISGVAARLGRA